MYICNALFKHGYYNFSLEILEYCEPEKCLEREAFYQQKKLNPEYNISLNPSAPMYGRNHSEETKTKISPSFGGMLKKVNKNLKDHPAGKAISTNRSIL